MCHFILCACCHDTHTWYAALVQGSVVIDIMSYLSLLLFVQLWHFLCPRLNKILSFAVAKKKTMIFRQDKREAP